MSVEETSTNVTRSEPQPGMSVVGAAGKTLGVVDSVERDAQTGEAMTFTVKHGLFHRKHKRIPIPMHEIREVRDQQVLLLFTWREFKELADIEDRGP